MLPLAPSECYKLWDFVNQCYKQPSIDPFDFEDRVAEILSSIGFTSFQRRRVHGKSCSMHEHDIIAKKIGGRDFILVECKTGDGFLDKTHVFALFGKAFDIFNLPGRRLEIRFNDRPHVYDFEDVYCMIVSNLPLDKAAFVCSLALGIMAVQPYDIFDEYASLPPSLVESYWIEGCGRDDIDPRFRQDLSELTRITFRNLFWSQAEIFNGNVLYRRLERFHGIVQSLVQIRR